VRAKLLVFAIVLAGVTGSAIRLVEQCQRTAPRPIPAAAFPAVSRAGDLLRKQALLPPAPYEIRASRGSNFWLIRYSHAPMSPDAEVEVFVYDDGRTQILR
jgi:hypothetical protein